MTSSESQAILDSSVMGPRWLGIGAQRSGTTWFTNLITQHPRVGTLERKEQHELYRSLLGGWPDSEKADYLDRFDDDSVLLGDFTPYYLRALWVPSVVDRLLEPSIPIIVILRNPIERFASAIRHEMTMTPEDRQDTIWLRRVASDAQWGGMYATQLDAWVDELGRDRILVFQYERVVLDPQSSCEQVWDKLGLAPIELTNTSEPSWTTSTTRSFTVERVPGLRRSLAIAYRPEIERLRDYGIDPHIWDLDGPS